jgi:hypothetical protein
MPGGKRRLKQVLTGGLQVGAVGDYFDQILSGSVSVSVPGFAGTVSPSTETVEVTLANLGASDRLAVTPDIDMSACAIIHSVRAGAGQASMVFRYAGSGASMDAASVDMHFIAFSRG